MIRAFMLFFLFLFLVGCGRLSEQQANSQKIKEGLEDHSIKRVTEDQIITEAHEQGSYLVDLLEQQSKDISFWQSPDGRKVLDSTNQAMGHYKIQLIPLRASTKELLPEESSLIEAYLYSLENDQPIHENVQNIQDDFLLFTSPINSNNEFVGIWSFHLSRKAIIRSL